MKLLLYINLTFLLTFSTLFSQFKVVQSNPKNYSYDPVTKIHKLTDGTNRMQATVIWNDSNIEGYEKLNLKEDFIIEAEMYFGFKDKEGADGIAFVLQSQGDNSIGSLGVGMGFAMNPYDGNKRVYPSFGVEIDTWYNHPGSPPAVDRVNADHISYIINGNMNDMLGDDEFAKYDYNTNTHKDIEDGKFHCVKYHWDAELEVLSVYFDGQLRKSDNLTAGLNRKLSELLNAEEVWWGFSTGTATRDNVHMLIFKKILRGDDAKITNVNTNTSTLIGKFCEKTVSPCDNNIEFSLDETGLQIVEANWILEPPIYDNVTFSNNNKSIKDIIDADKKYIIEVTYSDGTKAKDSVFASYLNLDVKLPDTLYLCQNFDTKLEGELYVNGTLEANNSRVLWNWRPFGLFDKLEDNIAYLMSGISDTTISCDIVYQVSDSVTKCVLSKQVVLINREQIFDLAIDSLSCTNEKTVRIVGKNGKPINLDGIKNISWGLNSEMIDDKFHISMDSIRIEDTGLLEVSLETKGGCIFNFSQNIYQGSNRGDQDIIPNIETDYCFGDTVIISPIGDFDYYLWNGLLEAEELIITKSGEYFIFAIDSTTGCEFTDTINISFHDYPNFNLDDYNYIICNEKSVQIDLNTDDENSVKWYDEDGNLLSEEQVLSISQPSKIFARIENKYGCSVETGLIDIRSSKSDKLYKLTDINGGNEINFDGVRRNRLYEKHVLIENLIDSTYSIDLLKLESKINFSIPSSQFPIELTPYDVDTISVVLYSEKSENLSDAIFNNNECETELIKLTADFELESYNFIDKCGIVWYIGEASKINLSKPYPNPAENKIKLDYFSDMKLNELKRLSLTITDIFGNEYGCESVINDNTIEIYIENNIRNGIYFLNLGLTENLKIFPIIITK